MPTVDEETRGRLRSRFGRHIDAWLGELPSALAVLRQRWDLELHELIPHGSRSVIVRCAMADGRAAVLKLAPDRENVELEAAALSGWSTPHAPAVYAVDAEMGALLIEAIEPGRMLRDVPGYPSMARVGELLGSLRAHGSSAEFPPLTRLISNLFDSWVRQRRLHPELVELVPGALFDAGRRFALRLAAATPPAAVLHGDLTPVNVLDGGDRGLVAIDPSPVVGDPAYDSIDLLVWQAEDVDTLEARAAELAPAAGIDATRVLDWCVAFAPMFVLDLAGPGQRHDDRWRDRAGPFLQLASQIPT